jgi:hypothetical protein
MLREWELIAYDKEIEIVPGVKFSYPWVAGESYDVELMTRTGSTIAYEIEDAEAGTQQA